MEPNTQVLQPVEILFIFGKRTPDTPDGMVWGQMVWYGMVCDMVLVWLGYGMGFTFHGTMVLVWSSYTTLEWGILGPLKWVTEVNLWWHLIFSHPCSSLPITSLCPSPSQHQWWWHTTSLWSTSGESVHPPPSFLLLTCTSVTHSWVPMRWSNSLI